MKSVLPGKLQAAVGALSERPVAVTDKGFGRLTRPGPVSAGRLALTRPSLFGGDFVLPVMVLRESAVRGNIQSMADYCAAAGVQLAPHGKTTMAPQLLALQLEAGAWGVTAATVAQVQVFRSFGMPRILVANEVTDRAAIEWLADELAADPDFDCYCFVDSLAGVALFDDAMQAASSRRRSAGRADPIRPVRALVELGRPGGRAGCRSVDEAVTVAKAVSATSGLRLAGAAGYEGSIGHDDSEATLTAIAEFCRDLRRLGTLVSALPGCEGDYILSAGGSAYFDIVVRELTAPAGAAPTVILRSGAYISHDHGFYQRLSPGGRTGRDGPALMPAFTPAFELWASVLSRPEPGLAIIGAGRHDVAFDQDMPVPLRICPPGGPPAVPSAGASSPHGMRISALDDQHGYLRVPADATLAPGDLVCLGISHPCTNFDKWRVIPVVDDGYRVIDAVHTFF